MAFPFIAKKFLKRPLYTIASPKKPIAIKDIFVGAAISFISMGILAIIFSQIYKMNYQGLGALFSVSVVPFIILTTIGFLIQTSFEEMWYRGYYMQFVRFFTDRKWLIILIPALSFALKHISNISAYHGSATAVLPYFFMAIMFGYTAYRLGSILMSIGIHWANNVFLTLIVASTGDVVPTQHALFVLQQPSLIIVAVHSLAQMIITIALVEYVVKRRKDQLRLDKSLQK